MTRIFDADELTACEIKEGIQTVLDAHGESEFTPQASTPHVSAGLHSAMVASILKLNLSKIDDKTVNNADIIDDQKQIIVECKATTTNAIEYYWHEYSTKNVIRKALLQTDTSSRTKKGTNGDRLAYKKVISLMIPKNGWDKRFLPLLERIAKDKKSIFFNINL